MGDQILHKLVFIGDGASGKSCLINRLVNDQFDDQYEPTVFDEEKIFYEVSEDGSYNLSKTETKTSRVLRYYDTAGQEDFETLRKLAYRGCDILVIVFSIVNKDSFDNVRAKWNQDRKAHMSKAKAILVGTKSDLVGDPNFTNCVKKEEAEQMRKSIKATNYIETSSKTGDGVPNVLQEVFKQISLLDQPKTKSCNII